MLKLLTTHVPAAVIIIRLKVGAVFVLEGSQKFMYPAEVRAGRFEKIGFPSPKVVAAFVGLRKRRKRKCLPSAFAT